MCVCVWVNTIAGSASYIRRPVCRVPLPIFHFPQFSTVVTFHFSYVDCHTHAGTHSSCSLAHKFYVCFLSLSFSPSLFLSLALLSLLAYLVNGFCIVKCCIHFPLFCLLCRCVCVFVCVCESVYSCLICCPNLYTYVYIRCMWQHIECDRDGAQHWSGAAAWPSRDADAAAVAAACSALTVYFKIYEK